MQGAEAEETSKPDTIETIYLISPASALTLIPFAAGLEWGSIKSSPFFNDGGILTLVMLNAIGSGLFAFAMIYVELALLERTSPLSLSIIGYLKQILQVIISILIF